MIELRGLTKRYKHTVAVDNVTVQVRPGRVTGFLGPNGAGKTTTMRLIVGLERPTSGTAIISGVPYAELRSPLRQVGALLDAAAVHPGRRARDHLLAAARSHGIDAGRVDEVLAMVGLDDVADRRVGVYSLGMRQRLGIAGALLGDPEVLLLDEPVNGLDPEGVRWVRRLTQRLAADGRTVLVSSHLMSEMQQTADHLVVIGSGRVLADESLDTFVSGRSLGGAIVATPDAERFAASLCGKGYDVTTDETGRLHVDGASTQDVGELAHAMGVVLHELAARTSSLEDVFMEVTERAAQFTTTKGPR